jgi:hypothetical protein
MLSQLNHWMQYVGVAVDALLLLRILTLKLHRSYIFITLSSVLAVFFDAIAMWLGSGSREFTLVFVYSRFLYAIVYPVAAWDVFEELKSQLANLRRMAIARTITSLLLVTVFGLLLSSFAPGNDEDPNGMAFLYTLSMVVWTGATTGSLSFLWVMHRGIRAQKVDAPHNTFVWMIYYELSLIGEVLYCFYLLVGPIFNNTTSEILLLLLALGGVLISCWCIFKLKALPSEAPPAQAPANI